MDDCPTVSVLLLGDSECGKSTFLSKLSQGSQMLSKPLLTIPSLRDEDQPFVYDIRMYNRPYRFELYDTASPVHFTLLKPDFVILCYDISNRASLQSLQNNWFKKMVEWYMTQRDDIPVMVLGLKRDLREENDDTLYPQEAHRVAAELRCDLYAECSAMTGELMSEVFEDLARRAARTTTQNGGMSDGGCVMM